MATDATPTQSRSFLRRLLDGIWFLIRLLIMIVAVIAFGALVFYGSNMVYEGVLLPLHDTIDRVDTLEQAMQEERNSMTAQLGLRDQRITQLESLVTKQKRELSTQNNKLDAQQVELEALTTLTSEMETLENQLKVAKSDIKTINSELSEMETLENQLKAAKSDIKTINSELSDMQTQTTALEEAAGTLSSQSETFTSKLDDASTQIDDLQEAASDAATMLDRVEQDRLLLHAQANLLNAQRALSRRDVGMANEYLQRAEVSLKAAFETMPKSEQGAMALVLTRLNQALDRLENDPFSAAADLQGVWRALDSVILGELSVGLPLPAELSDQTAEESSENQEEATSSEEEANSEEETSAEEETSSEDE